MNIMQNLPKLIAGSVIASVGLLSILTLSLIYSPFGPVVTSLGCAMCIFVILGIEWFMDTPF